MQQALVDCHGSQCGFCTPGFVMSLWATYQHHTARGTRPTRQQLADELSGNLCRCTGYRPILDAGERMFDLPPARARRERAGRRPCRPAEALPLKLQSAGGAEFSAPTSLADFAAERLADPEARILAGSTDIGLWVNKMFRELPRLALHRQRRRAEASRRDGGPAVDRRRRLARGRLARAGRALADAGRGLAALCRRAAAPHRNDRRQRRQWLADRRLGAGADGARRVARAASRRRRCGACRSPISTPAT